MGYKHLAVHERETISQMRFAGATLTAIAQDIGRCAGTISRELNRNKSPSREPNTSPSLNSAGRGVLLEQCSQAAPRIRSVIKTILAERVTATRKLKRWGFMTQEEISSVESSIGRVNRD